MGVVPAETLGKSDEGREGGKQRVSGSRLDMAGASGANNPVSAQPLRLPSPTPA